MAGSAIGALKTAAARVGLTVSAYLDRQEAGQKWCTGCKAWHPVSDFPLDRSRGDSRRATCLVYQRPLRRNKRYEIAEHRAARLAVRADVMSGRLVRPNLLPCMDCGHLWSTGERRHEYDHFRGYAKEHWLHVQPVCTTCHADRERSRRGSAA